MRARIVIGLYALLALTIVNVFPHFPSPNELARWALAAAIVDGHTLEVTRYAPPGIEDLSERDGRLYSNKAPGGTLVGLPGYALARLFTNGMRPTLYAMRIFAATLPAVLLAFAFASVARSTKALVALLFGTPLFAYGMLNFSHALAAAALFGAWVLLEKRAVAAGALLGLAILSEYPLAAPALVLIACAPWRSWWKIAAGGAPFALLLGLYNELAFGSWLTLSSGHERFAQFREMASSGVFGVGVPNPITLMKLLFDPARGLFVFSPVLLLGLAALPHAKRALPPRAFWSLVFAPLALILLYSGYPNWHGGWTVGARYLVPALPFLALLLAYSAATKLESFLLGASIAACVLTSIVFPFVPPELPAPWGTFAIPLLADGLIAPNLFHLVARPLALLVPFALAIAATARKDLMLLAGAVVMIVVGVTVPLDPFPRVERAYISQTFFGRADEALQMAPELVRRSDVQRRMPPPPWPF